jgi:NDP-sugar pyrophosphorylase family protein
VVVGVVPAAGSAARLQPLDRSKEMLEVRDRPVLEYLVERMRAAAADEIRVVTRPEKKDVAEHAERLGATVVLGRPEHVSASLVAGLVGLDGDDVVLFGFPDTVWEPVDGFAPLRALVEAGEDLALGLFEGADLERSDVVVLDEGGRVSAIDVKPVRPRSSWIWGCGTARASLLSGTARDAEPGVYFDRLARQRTIAAIKLSNMFIDIGTPESLAALRAGESA